jgi:predicted DNA binding protein
MTLDAESNTMWECLLGVRHRGCPISDTSASFPDVSVLNVSKADIPGDRGRRLVYLRSDPDDIEAFEAACRAHESTVTCQRMSDGERGNDAYFVTEVEYDEANPSVLSLLNSQGIFHQGTIMVQRGVEHWRVYSEEKSTIQDLASELEAYDNDVFLYRLVDLHELGHVNDVEFSLLLSQLTERQRIAFQTALELGYYDGSSAVTVSDIAEELAVHETTAWEHLKKAENAILTEVGNHLFSTLEFEEAQA